MHIHPYIYPIINLAARGNKNVCVSCVRVCLFLLASTLLRVLRFPFFLRAVEHLLGTCRHVCLCDYGVYLAQQMCQVGRSRATMESTSLSRCARWEDHEMDVCRRLLRRGGWVL